MLKYAHLVVTALRRTARNIARTSKNLFSPKTKSKEMARLVRLPTQPPVPYISGARADKRLYVIDERLNNTVEDIEQRCQRCVPGMAWEGQEDWNVSRIRI
jgi:hypothetical protein